MDMDNFWHQFVKTSCYVYIIVSCVEIIAALLQMSIVRNVDEKVHGKRNKVHKYAATTAKCSNSVALETGTENNTTRNESAFKTLDKQERDKIRRERNLEETWKKVTYDDYMNMMLWEIRSIFINVIQLILTVIFIRGIDENNMLTTTVYCAGTTLMVALNLFLILLLLKYCTNKTDMKCGIFLFILMNVEFVYLMAIGYIFLSRIVQNKI